MRRRDAFVVVALVVGLAAPATPRAAAFSGMNVFGDSLSDMGNVFDLTEALPLVPALPAPPYFEGRFSNGPVYAEVLAGRLGLALDNSLDGGTNYAFGGAGTDFQAPEVPAVSPLSIEGQVAQFFARRSTSGDPIDDEELFVVFGGLNNLQRALDRPDEAESIVNDAAGDIAAIVGDLRNAGARHVLVPNAPNLARAPEYLGNPVAEDVSVRFNERLAALSGPGVTVFDSFGLLETAATEPATFGFTNVAEPCFTGDRFGLGADATQCANPDAYLFWDELHPSAAAHAALGEAMALAVIPIPGSILLLGSALAGIALIPRVSRRGRL